MIKIIFSVLLVMFYCSGFLTADDTVFVISRQKAVEMALQNNEDVLIKKASVEKSKAFYTETHALTYPQLSANIGWRRYFELPSQLKSAGYSDYSFEAASTLTQIIWAFGKVSTAVDIAEHYLNVENDALKLTRAEIAFAANSLYYSALYAANVLGIAKQSYENALENQKMLESRFKMGRVSRIDNIKMAADVAVREPEVLRAKKELMLLTNDLKTLLHIDSKSEVVLSGEFERDFPDLSPDELENSMVQNEASLILLRDSVRLYKSTADLKKKQALPELSAFGSYSYGGMGRRVLPQKSNMAATTAAGLNLKLTLWDSFAAYGSYRQALADVSIADINYQKRLRELINRLNKLYVDYNASREIYKSNRRALEVAKESYAIALSSLKSGSATLTQVNDAELMLTSAKMGMNSVLFSLNLIAAEIKRLTSDSY